MIKMVRGHVRQTIGLQTFHIQRICANTSGKCKSNNLATFSCKTNRNIPELLALGSNIFELQCSQGRFHTIGAMSVENGTRLAKVKETTETSQT